MSISNTLICSCCNVSFVNKSDFILNFDCCIDSTKHKCVDCICIFHPKIWLPNLSEKDLVDLRNLSKKQPIKLCCIQRAAIIHNIQQIEFNSYRKKINTLLEQLYDRNEKNFNSNNNSNNNNNNNN